ncbi:MAG: hypothetical protein KKC96_03060, partial [Nanoarchaeota archaeon]|nr:hypothetical protein [Nanoarchaeota archaeon]
MILLFKTFFSSVRIGASAEPPSRDLRGAIYLFNARAEGEHSVRRFARRAVSFRTSWKKAFRLRLGERDENKANHFKEFFILSISSLSSSSCF